MESLVPRHMFKDHTMAAEYLAWVEERQAEFDAGKGREASCPKPPVSSNGTCA